jgi:outer membrane protein OmpA-like peptidoglycan-associated protein
MEWAVPTTGLPAVKDLLVAQLLTRVQGVDSAAARAVVSIDGMSIERKAKEQIAGEEIERYSLILFAFDNATITPEHERQLERIRAKMRDGAHVRIIGMTDAMGSSAYNLDLSRRRALEVAKALGSDESAIEARGAEQPRFSNERPEGRAYNRTVIIEVKTHR